MPPSNESCVVPESRQVRADDGLELVVLEEDGSSSRVICIAIEGDAALTGGSSSARRPGA